MAKTPGVPHAIGCFFCCKASGNFHDQGQVYYGFYSDKRYNM